MADNETLLVETVKEAYAGKVALSIKGGGSKEFYGFPVQGETLDTTIHAGIISHEPTELVLTARAGTSLQEIEVKLAEANQMLGCEPLFISSNATFGGMLAAGLSGPRRPFTGSISDHVLGCKIINGKGEVLRFGGKVMKNVAGYDVSRLMVGALGCLGIILEATVRVLPQPGAERSFRFDITEDKIAVFINKLTGMGYPVSANVHDQKSLVVRFSAGVQEIENLGASLKQEFPYIEIAEEKRPRFWQELRDQNTEFFNTESDIWRLSVPADSKLDVKGETLSEWNGAQRWLKTGAGAAAVFDSASKVNGSATLFRTSGSESVGSIFQPLSPALMNWHSRLKNAFDPSRILNPGRMYLDL